MKFPRQKHAPSKTAKAYQASVAKHPFLMFGLPFIAMVVAGSFILSPITAQRYDVDDRKRRFDNKQEKFDTTGLKRRKFDATEEYYVSLNMLFNGFRADICVETSSQRSRQLGTETSAAFAW
jgi:cytochrome c oxidase assembly protein subunit 16